MTPQQALGTEALDTLAAIQERLAKLESENAHLKVTVCEDRRQMYEQIFDNSLVPTWIKYRDQIVYINDAALALLGRSREEILGRSPFEFIPQHTQEADQATHFEDRLLQNDGTGIPVEVYSCPVPYASEVAVHTSIFNGNRRAPSREQAMLESGEQYRLLIEAMPQLVWLADSQGSLIFCNRFFRDYAGLTQEECKRVTVVHPDDLPTATACWQEAVLKAEGYEIEYRLRRASDHSYRWVSASLVPVKDQAGQVSYWIGTAIDIDDKRRAEVELRKQAEQLARSNADLQHFSFIASHDLQEPLRNIAIYSELLVARHRQQLDEDARQLLDFILSGAKRGQALTQALLSYARAVDANNVQLAPVMLDAPLDSALSNLKSKIFEAGATVTRDALPGVTADEIQIVQLFQNLIENAIKYRSQPNPHIHISATRHQDENPVGQWIISVRDNGTGVPQTHWEKIFEPFQRLHGQKVSGSGIGLATCKRIVERHGGKIWVESEPGSGSTFYFTLQACGSELGT